ncbi:threonine synthase [Campylobacter sp. MIT 12-5580]|uniref:threonine synthase n=1 Tax=Campylobacter sp. MIT 12-5580 TaxID=2040651 RepID=UPI0010F49232|nr:threonine synthase [Campylobacter sp. MIT 12-5580]TKX29008.1 threonine synthase [Campylobacter sp. MIT 12-5580]
MLLVGTRDKSQSVSFKEALLNPAAHLGGLYAPLSLPKFNGYAYKDLSYNDFALKLIQSFEFGFDEDFKEALKSYKSFDDETCPVRLNKISEKLFINELYHGPTRAFKDMALQPFGVLLKRFSEGKNFLVCCATSGDTGPATLKSFENSQVKVVCIYPKAGTSRLQALQMRALDKDNLKVFAINGDFDTAQNTLKALLNDTEFKQALKTENIELSAANSVNFARILFQIIYHYYACIKIDKELEIIIPSGNFGDALGAYYAKKMGAKIKRIKIASNANNILSEFFNTGKYDLRGKKLVKTLSPAMDILISSNIERLLFDQFGDVRTLELMNALKEKLHFELTKNELESLKEDFEADFCTDLECKHFIKDFSKSAIIDPHTATCFKLLNPHKTTLITSTAEWSKFVPSMYEALFNKSCNDEKEAMLEIAEAYGEGIKTELLDLFDLEKQAIQSYEARALKDEILRWIKK